MLSLLLYQSFACIYQFSFTGIFSPWSGEKRVGWGWGVYQNHCYFYPIYTFIHAGFKWMTNICMKHTDILRLDDKKNDRGQIMILRVDQWQQCLLEINCFIFVVDFCFINSICLSGGQTQIEKDCLVCQPNSSRTDWTLKKGLFNFY